jgi:hypothetical protein
MSAPEHRLKALRLPTNVEAARAPGIKAIQFSIIERLRVELIAAGMHTVLPLP